MGTVDITSGITGFFQIFNTFINILKNTNITIGSVSFTLWGLMWSLLFLSMFISFLYRALES